MYTIYWRVERYARFAVVFSVKVN